jgi:signal peptidase II
MLMNKHDWSKHFLLLGLLWGIDFLTKWLAMKYVSNPHQFGIFSIVLHYNPGVMLGTFSGLPPVLRVVSLSTGGAFLFCIYLALQYLIPMPALKLRYGMTILLSGIIGNVTDRIIRGAVADFLVVGWPGLQTAAFNFADAIQWVGYGLIVYFLIREGHLFWPEQNERKKLWINPSFQLKYVITLQAIAFGFLVIMGVFFYTYLKITIDDLAIVNPMAAENRFLQPFFITFVVIAISFLSILFILARQLSHRTAGPLYAFEKYLADLLDGKTRKFKLRAGDEFPHLEELADKLNAHFEKINPPAVGDEIPSNPQNLESDTTDRTDR